MKLRVTAVLTAFLLATLLHAQRVREEMLVSPSWLQRRLGTVTVLHVGDRASYDAGHIPDAVLIEPSSLLAPSNELPPVEDLVKLLRAAGVDANGRVVVYSHDPLLAARAWFTLDYLGHGEQTSLLDGGFTKWVTSGGAVSRATPVIHAGDFVARVQPRTLMRIDTLRERLHDFVLVDARPPEQFSGEQPGAGVPKGGHIPGAINVPFRMHFDAAGAYKPADELRKLYTPEISRPTRNVAYCRTGMQAAVTYFVLKYLGYDAALYDGSYLEWSNAGAAAER